MYHIQGTSKQHCSLLAVLCGSFHEEKPEPKPRPEPYSCFTIPDLVSSGRLEVQTLVNPTFDKFREALKLAEPNVLYFQGEKLENEEIGSLAWGGVDMSDPQILSSLIGPALPTIVYLEVPNSKKIAQAVHSKGVPYVIFWKNAFFPYAASHFRQALFSVVQSSCSHTWDAFQLAHASFRLYCIRNNYVLPENNQQASGKFGPCLLGDAPKINVAPAEVDMDEEEGPSEPLPSIKIYDEDVDVRFLVCGVTCILDACILGSLEDGLNALLNIEIRGSRLQNRVSATPPPLQAGTFTRGVVTMRCDLTTCSSAHLSLLVSGSAQTCFDDQLLESHIKNELIEKSRLIHAPPSCEESKSSLPDPLNFAAIACGASVFEVSMKLPIWAAQVLKHLAPEISYRSLVALGIASIQGTPVASFEKEDADRLLFFCTRQGKDMLVDGRLRFRPPRWSAFLLSDRQKPGQKSKPTATPSTLLGENGVACAENEQDDKERGLIEGIHIPSLPARKRLKLAALKPIPHSRHHKMLPFIPETNLYDGNQVKPNLPSAPVKHNVVPLAPIHRKSTASSLHAQPIIPLNPLPMKKHGCDRALIQVCPEEEFLKDVMQFLILRGHSRLVPQGGISEFPDAILNAKRLDLYNLYREVVSRGGFYVGNGINWKGQVFSKMRNHTMTNRMTGVGNTLKRHYETYLLEYELAHDDVDGECCLLCHSSAPGDWVNCGLCGEWAHFGCDRRQGLGTFKRALPRKDRTYLWSSTMAFEEYAKTDGLEYICPHCGLSNGKKKTQKMGNGFGNASSSVARHL